jgi:hypothetical protein
MKAETKRIGWLKRMISLMDAAASRSKHGNLSKAAELAARYREELTWLAA